LCLLFYSLLSPYHLKPPKILLAFGPKSIPKAK
jgi:hypothetical protein